MNRCRFFFLPFFRKLWPQHSAWECITKLHLMSVHAGSPQNTMSAFTLILKNSTDTVNLCHSTHIALLSSCIQAYVWSLYQFVSDALLQLPCFCTAHILVCNRHMCSHERPKQLTSGVVNLAVWRGWHDCISRPEWYSDFKLRDWERSIPLPVLHKHLKSSKI